LYGLFRPLLFALDPERAHALAMRWLAERGAWTRSWHDGPEPQDPVLGVEVAGIRFPNPVGVAAGFDKDGEVTEGLAGIGFGFVEVGTVTPLAQPGNPRPRMWRLPRDRALVNRLGFNNHGAEAMAATLAATRTRRVPVGINVGKNKDTPLDRAVDDYRACIARLHGYADYLVVNVSSPNTPGLRDLADEERLSALLAGVMEEVRSHGAKPVFLKVAPDHADDDLRRIADTALAAGVTGFIATNTTVERKGLSTANPPAEGGLSGKPVFARAVEVVSLLRAHTKAPIIGVGGIFDADDAARMLEAGANLVQVFTGFVYGGPGTPKRICDGLRARWRGAREGAADRRP